MSIGEACTRHQQNVAAWIIDCCSAVGRLAISFNCWYSVFRQCWSYDNVFAYFSAIKQSSWQFKKFFRGISTPLYRHTHTCTGIDMHVHVCAHTQAHTRTTTCVFVLQQGSSDKRDFLPYNFKAFLVLTEYSKILLLQTVLVCEKVFPDIFF